MKHFQRGFTLPELVAAIFFVFWLVALGASGYVLYLLINVMLKYIGS